MIQSGYIICTGYIHSRLYMYKYKSPGAVLGWSILSKKPSLSPNYSPYFSTPCYLLQAVSVQTGIHCKPRVSVAWRVTNLGQKTPWGLALCWPCQGAGIYPPHEDLCYNRCHTLTEWTLYNNNTIMYNETHADPGYRLLHLALGWSWHNGAGEWGCSLLPA